MPGSDTTCPNRTPILRDIGNPNHPTGDKGGGDHEPPNGIQPGGAGTHESNPDSDTTPTESKAYPMIRRTITLLTITGLLTATLTLPASAYGSDSGSVSCSNKVAVHSRSTFDVHIQVPFGTTVKSYYDGPSPVERTTATDVYGPSSWRVLSTDGYVWKANTYAYCYGQ